MSNYYLIIVWIGMFGLLSTLVDTKRMEDVCDNTVRRTRPGWAIALVVPLVIWTAYRGYVVDTGSYIQAFENMPEILSEIPNYMGTVDKDSGFYFMSVLIKCLITTNVNYYFMIVATLQAFLLFRVYRKHSTRYVISFFLFIASTDYVSWMFNGMRQFVAVTITLFAFEYILDKKYIKAILIILVASLFHQSALLVIPFVFVVQGDAWNVKTLLFIMLVILAVGSVEQFTDLLDTVLQDTQYVNVVSDWKMSEDDGTNFFRVLVYSMLTILSFVGLRFIKTENDKVINVCTNMSIISLGFYVVSMFTSGIFIGRLPIYFSLYNYILLPWEIDHIFEKRSAKIITMLMIMAYLAFYYYQIHWIWAFA